MNLRSVFSVLSYLLIILSFCLLAPLGVAIGYDSQSPREFMEIIAFSTTAALSLGLGLWLRIKYKKDVQDIGRREGFAIVTFSWLAMVLLGMLPYLISGVVPNVTDAFFETMSGFTTTGATIFGGPGMKIENIPHGLQFWRCMTQWLGGMGIVVLSVALLSFLRVGGYHLIKAETPGGVAFERERPRMTDAAKELWKLYLLLSAAEVLLLKLSGTDFFDAFCHTFTTMSTGGFSPHTKSAAFFPPQTQWIIIVFMFLAGTNFSLHNQLVRGRFSSVIKNLEFRFYVGIMLVVSLLAILTTSSQGDFLTNVRDAIFQTVSIGTTTGYATADFDKWPQMMRVLLVILMFCGGCMGSTGGGMKVARMIIYTKAFVRELHRLIFPRAIRPIRTGDKIIDPKIVANILAFGTVYAALFLLGALVMSAYEYDMATSLSASASAIGNIGPGLAKVGPMADWSHLPDPAKWVMSILMLSGRLEIFSVLILFTPWVWKR